MRCSNCGKDVPFAGKVCPYCHVDKTSDQQKQVLGIFFGFIGGALGWFIHGVIAALIGLVIGVIVGLVAASKMKS
ncbi:hypothetical protein [Mycobacterium paraense]|uniref:hypothetical protein n=1 Tax=Mycobacterium paraense TaxID=767916 RepID=UPI0014821DEA|nr:hypothetical protein [Mycobacterium paraense]